MGPINNVTNGLNTAVPPSAILSNESISAERAALTSALTDGVSTFECMVIASDTTAGFPFPDGRAREFMSGFGDFPVVLVNSRLETRHTTTQELYPMSNTAPATGNTNDDAIYMASK